MDDLTQHTEKIDLYLAGRMDDEESRIFEKEIDTNPTLQEEIRMQEQLISGIRHARKMQLKSRLEMIEIAPQWHQFLQTGTAKILYGVVGAVAIGTLVYLWPTPAADPEVDDGDPIVVMPPSEEPVAKIIIPEINTSNQVVGKTSAIKLTPDASSQKNNADDQQVDKKTEALTDRSFFTPEIALPEEEIAEDEADFQSETFTDDDITTPISPDPNGMTIEVFNEGNTRSYKYFQGKLALFGDFTGSPYEVLEVNTDLNKEIYLYYDGTYYSIIMTRITIPLKKVTDARRIGELEILRKNK